MNITLTTPKTSTAMENSSIEDCAHESTYALLVRSEEKSRSAIEAIIYALCILSSVVAIWQFVHQPLALPITGIASVADSAISAGKHHVSKPKTHS